MAQERNNSGLQSLKKSNYEVKDGYTDIRGWDVKDGGGRTIGEVEDLLFDPASNRVRYMVVELDDNDFDLEERDVLIPVGVAELHEKDDDVIIQNITAEQLRALPEYDDDNFSNEQERSIRSVFADFGGLGMAGAAAATSGTLLAGNDQDDFYSHDHFNEENLYRNRRGQGSENEAIPVIRENLEVGKREVETGSVRLRSRIVEEEVTEQVNLREESVQVERTPVDRPATQADLREEEIEMRERAEVPVVNKEARVVEEISLSKEVTERNEIIQDTVRNTEVDIEETGGAANQNNAAGYTGLSGDDLGATNKGDADDELRNGNRY